MCSNQSPIPSPNMASTSAVVPYAMKPMDSSLVPPQHQFQPPPSGLLPMDQYRLQLYNYAMVERLRGFTNFVPYNNQMPFCGNYPYNPRLALQMSLFHNRVFQPEEPKPQHSYIGLIAMAILSSPETKLVLSDIYQYILDNYSYFRTRGPGWRNSIRHNLSLNDCFIKAGRSANGKGHYWAIHPANVEDFKKGDFRRRKAQRKVRKHMGLAVDEEGEDSPSPPPVPMSPPPPRVPMPGLCPWPTAPPLGLTTAFFPPIPSMARKRQFDVASLLAPDDDKDCTKMRRLDENYNSSGEEVEAEEDIDVVSEDLSMSSSRRTERHEEETERERAPSGGQTVSSPQPCPASSPTRASSESPTRASPPLPLWVRQPGVVHPTAMFPPSTLSFMEHQQQIVNRFYEHSRMSQQRRYFHPNEEMSPVNLKNEDT